MFVDFTLVLLWLIKIQQYSKYQKQLLFASIMQISQSDIECQHMLYSTPPNLEDCYRHRRANIIFKNLESSDISQVLLYNYCECCGRIVGQLPKPKFNYDPIEAAYLGPGIPLYFAFFRSVLYLILVYLVVFGFYTTFTNINGKYCQNSCGTSTFWNKISVFNIFNQYLTLQVQTYFQLAVLVITILVNLSIRSYMNYLQIYIDEFFAKPSDYSIIIRNIPKDASKDDIEQMIEKRRETLQQQDLDKTDNLKIVDILMVMELKQFLEVERKNLDAIKKHIKMKQQNPNLGEVYFENPIIPNKFARTAIVIFSSSLSKSYFLGAYGFLQKLIRTLWGSYYAKSNIHKVKNQFVSIYRAPEPDDLIWSNCGIKSSELLLRRIGLYILSLIILGIGGGLQYLIEFVRNKFVSVQNPYIQFMFSLAAAITITTFNFLLGLVLEFMASREGHDTKTQLRVAITFRIVIFQFINSGMLVVFSNIFVKITTDQIGYDFRKTVLSSNIMQMMVVNAILGNSLTFFINKFQLMKRYPRWKILNKKQLYPQIQANKAFQGPDIFMHIKYAYVFKTFWLTAFFMSTVPPVIIVSMCGLVFNYWLQKYLFSGVYNAPQAISSYLSNHVLNLLDYTPLWMTLGSLFVHFLRKNFQFNQIQSQIKNVHYLLLILSVINIFLPYYGILKRFTKYRQRDTNESTYEQSACTFELTYEDTNPLYLNHHKKRIRDEEIFKQKLVRQTDFREMKMRLSQSQVLTSHKQSLMLGKSSMLTDEIGDKGSRRGRVQRFSSL